MKLTIPIDRWEPARGGAERYLDRLARSLAARGHEVVIACLEARHAPGAAGEGAGGGAGDGAITVATVSVPRWPRWLRELRFARASAALHRARGPGVLLAVRHALEADVYQPHGSTYAASRRARLAALPAAFRWLHAAGEALRPSAWVLRRLDREVFRRSPGLLVITLSRKVEDDLRALGPGLPGRHVRIPIGIDLEAFHDADREERARALRARHGVPSGARIALFLAHDPRLKGLDAAVAAVARAGDWHLLAGGRRGESLGLRAARRHGVEARVRFLGPVEDSRALLAGADALLLPTLHDPCSTVSLEAVACGTPVITTRHNGAIDLIEPARAGWVVRGPEDIEGLVEGLARVAAAWEAYHARALALRPALDWDLHVGRIEAALEEGASLSRKRAAGAGARE